MYLFRPITAVALLVSLHASALAAGDAARGEEIYTTRCGGCHSVEENRIGPRHQGVVGRRAGSLKDFEYSPALRRSKIVWTPATLHQWLANPEGFIPGQRMAYRLSDASAREDVIAYLVAQSR